MLLIDEIAGQAAREIGPVPTARLTITVRELLHMRVELEWQAAHEERPGIVPGSPEARLNAGSKPQPRGFFAMADAGRDAARLARACAAAEQAFCDQQLFVLLDDSQATSLDQVVEVERTAAATFLLLTPLRGG